MGRPLRALIVEDVERDAALIVRELSRGGFDVTHERVDTPEAMSAALSERRWDIVISDYSLPRFSAPRALALVKERPVDLPFIIVSGTIGEDTAVEAMRAGAHDYLAKGNLALLVPAIERELREAALRAERSKMQEQLLISDRMASVGMLAAGVAHEINNPLAALIANLHFVADGVARLRREAEGGRVDEIDEPLEEAREAADRIRQIARDLKVFSRVDEDKKGPVDLRRVIESSLRMAWNEIRHRARLVKDYGEVPLVEGNESRLGQVFLNLIINAAHAMSEGRADRNELRLVTRRDGPDRVIVEVRDTGSGIPKAHLAKLFDPFFTTKPIGVGTGLGLSICHRIVTEHGGGIAVESEVGVGTLVRTTLPVGRPEEATVMPSLSAAAVPARRGRILVVDDEPVLCRVVQRMLAPDHEVVTLTSAREAIDRIAGGERFDVILCDLMMPRVTGMDLHAELARDVPEQAEKVVFMTGGAFTSAAREYLDRVPNPRVDKPFDLGTVRALVHGLLR